METYAKWKEAGHRVYVSIYMKSPETESRARGEGQGYGNKWVTVLGMEFLFGMMNIRQLIVVMVVHLCEYTKNQLSVCLNV